MPLEVVAPDLEEPGPHDVVVRMAAVAVCGTDLHQVRGERVAVSSKAALPTGAAVPLREAALLGCAALAGVGSSSAL
ncbi:GroES-like domain-containing Alcohol dehydrogenase [Gaiella occulta]|uniref:GroES-like domain-containing Alcohol dehydrogenase n=1 Tax=Gaiella occulta TaxID=1002870 RepID=A0A7M2YZS6_9ACTN|nr:alcohol dehydrogenase catalytic domain-containing protein [Gaiella occulta]RDI75519.1 GroES-like domain-containing Alcohol dehydrogenase [Gaiella occulta]